MKKQNKTPEEGLSKLEISSLTNKAFKVMTIRCSGDDLLNTVRSLTKS